MDRTEFYIQIVKEQPLLLAPVVLFIFAYLVIPSDKRLFISLLILVPWLTIGRSPGLGPLAAATKLTSGIAYLLIAYAAYVHPGPKRELPRVVWLFVIVACMGPFYVVTTQERMLALVLRSQWICVTLAGLFTAQTIVSFADLKRIVNALTWGCIFALSIPISGLILFPSDSFLRGVGRFQPWGVNSNQIGMLFALATPLLAYTVMSKKKVALKPLFMTVLALTIGMALLTASRQTMLAIILVMIPIFLVLTKRPVITIVGLGVAAISLPWLFSLGADADFERFSSIETGRLDIWKMYWKDVFPKRPLVGLMGTSGESYLKAVNEVGQHPHNAWFYLMYIGGVSFAAPMVYLTIYSLFSGWKMWLFRKRLAGDPLLYSILFMLLTAMYIQGLFNQVVYWPTYTWSFLHVVLAVLFISIWHDIRNGKIEEAVLDDEIYDEEYDWEEEIELEEFEDYAANLQRPIS